MSKQPFAIGDKVQYARHWLKSIYAHPTDPLWRLEGEVVGLKVVGSGKVSQPITLVRVQWYSDEEPVSCLPANLRRVGTAEPL